MTTVRKPVFILIKKPFIHEKHLNKVDPVIISSIHSFVQQIFMEILVR
jgi:hypothetical protein